MTAKKKVVTALMVFILIGGLVFLSGPRTEIDTELHPVELPLDLDDYIIQSEARYDTIVSGAEKVIIWAEDFHPKGLRPPCSLAAAILLMSHT